MPDNNGLNEAGFTFNEWKKAVDRLVTAKYQVGVDDLPDMPFRDHFDSGCTPRQFVSDVVVSMLEEEFGMLEEEFGIGLDEEMED